MNQERARVDVLHPTLCDETAKDGAPERWRDVVSEMRLVCGVQSCFARYPHLKIEIWGTRHPVPWLGRRFISHPLR